MSDWDEIKRLAADFQRTQVSDTLQRISERNCIDIVKKLTDLNLIELIYTCDGKQFITPAHLLKEIEDEIYVNAGRMHLHDLATNLNVDYQHVEAKAKELARDKPDDYSLVLGQVIHSTYKTTLGKQIQDCMLATGQLNIADFAKSLDLPSEFLSNIVKELLPKVVEDYVVGHDERTYYTSDMMDKYKSIIAGTLSAIVKPTTIALLMKRLDIPERIFTPTVDGLIKEGRIDATVENRLFIPSVYAREQNEWIDQFYSSNSYIEYDVLSRMDIKQPKAFLKKRFPNGIQLKTCFISTDLVSQVESVVEDSITSNSWIDISTIVPTAIESDDIEQLLQDIFKKNKQFSSSCHVLDKTNVCSLGYIATCKSSFNNLMQTRAQEHLRQGKLETHFLGERVKEPPRKLDDQISGSSGGTGVDKSTIATKEPSEDKEDAPREDKSVPHNTEDDESQHPAGKSSKKERKEKKGAGAADVDAMDLDDSDEDAGGRKSKGKKGGAGSQGREIKQRAVKKKYFPGNKGNPKGGDPFDEAENAPSKAPRSSKGRAARRAISPERTPTPTPLKSKGAQPKTVAISQKRGPLVFMDPEEIIGKLRSESRGSNDCSEEFFESLAELIQADLNAMYETLARKTLDEFIKTQADNDKGERVDSIRTSDADVDLME